MLAPPWLPIPPPRYGGIETVIAMLTDRLVDLRYLPELSPRPTWYWVVLAAAAFLLNLAADIRKASNRAALVAQYARPPSLAVLTLDAHANTNARARGGLPRTRAPSLLCPGRCVDPDGVSLHPSSRTRVASGSASVRPQPGVVLRRMRPSASLRPNRAGGLAPQRGRPQIAMGGAQWSKRSCST
jgi:hypothetical protein